MVASGSSTSNSLRVIRSGVGLEDTLSIEGIPGVQGIWPISAGDGQVFSWIRLARALIYLDL